VYLDCHSVFLSDLRFGRAHPAHRLHMTKQLRYILTHFLFCVHLGICRKHRAASRLLSALCQALYTTFPSQIVQRTFPQSCAPRNGELLALDAKCSTCHASSGQKITMSAAFPSEI